MVPGHGETAGLQTGGLGPSPLGKRPSPTGSTGSTGSKHRASTGDGDAMKVSFCVFESVVFYWCRNQMISDGIVSQDLHPNRGFIKKR